MESNNNFDPSELAKFSDLAHRWWDKESEFRPLHQINPLRLAWIENLVPIKGKRVLDVGCGGGILADAMARSGADVTGIDLAAKALKVAQLHALEAQTEGVLIAASRVANDAICRAISKASELRPVNQMTTAGQRAAWDNLSKEFGSELSTLYGLSISDCAQAGVNAMMAEAADMLDNPTVKQAFEQFLLVAELSRTSPAN